MRIKRVNLVVIILAIFLLALLFFFYRQYIKEKNNSMDIDSIKQVSPAQQYSNLNIITKQTPEQTYKKFRDYIKKGDSQQAALLFADKYRDKYKQLFEQAKQSSNLEVFYFKLDKTIVKDEKNCYLSKCSYLMSKSKTRIDFVKNRQGVWLIEAL